LRVLGKIIESSHAKNLRCYFFFLLVSAGSLPVQQTQPALNQQAQSPGEIAAEVETVSVLATVRDKHGKIISNLAKDDFVLEEDGRPQNINYFVRESDQPLRLGLLVDTSLSQRRVLEQERSASYSFLDHLLRPEKDLDFVIHYDREVELLQEFTSSRPKLQTALQALETPQLGSNAGGGGDGGSRGGGDGRGSRRRAGGTLLYDAIYVASDDLMSKQQGRKAVIILSDGVDRGSKETLATAIETAQREDTVVGGAAEDIRGKSGPTERKFCSKFPKPPADDCTKFRKKKR
jgi:VWFA-related protein